MAPAPPGMLQLGREPTSRVSALWERRIAPCPPEGPDRAAPERELRLSLRVRALLPPLSVPAVGGEVPQARHRLSCGSLRPCRGAHPRSIHFSTPIASKPSTPAA